MLTRHHRKQRQAQWVCLALQHPELILSAVQVAGGKGYIPARCQPRSKTFVKMIEPRLRVRGDHIHRHALKPMLTNHYRTPLSRSHISRDDQNTPGKYPGPDI